MTREFQERLRRRVARVGLTIRPEVGEQLEDYCRLLASWNRKINLTGLPVDSFPDGTLDRLLVEPLAAAKHVPDNACLIDIGSGGGSPAIPIRLSLPGVTLIMVESKARKAAFLREATRRLALTGTLVETARFEELLLRPDLHEAGDVLTMRAVRVDARILNTFQAFVKPGGAILLFRGPSGAEHPAGMTPPLTWEATFPLVESLRSRLIVIRKAGVGPSISRR